MANRPRYEEFENRAMDLEKAEQIYQSLAKIGRIISSTLTIEEAFEQFATEVKKIISFDRVNIGLINHEQGTYRIAYTAGLEIPDRLKGKTMPFSGLLKEAIRERSGVLLQPDREDEFVEDYPEFLIPFSAGIRSTIVAPMISKDQVNGVLYFASLSSKAYSDSDLVLAENVASQIAGAIASALLYDQIKETEKALRESEACYKSIFQDNLSIIFIRDPETECLIDVNPAACSFYGYSRDKMIGMDLAKITHSPLEIIRKRTKQTLIDGKNHFTAKQYLANGENRDVEVYNNTIMFGGQKAILAIIHDITERKKAEETLARRLEFERFVSKTSSEFVGMSSDEIDAGIERALASIGAFSGADRAYVFLFHHGEELADNTHEWCAEGVQPQIENLKDIPVAEELPWFNEQIRKHEVFHVPDVATLLPGARREREHFESQGIKSLIVVPMRLGYRLVGFLGFDAVRERKTWTEDDQVLLRIVGENFTNVIERERAEEALRESEEKYRNLYEEAPVGYMEFNNEGIVTNVNKKELEMFGYTKEEMVGEFLWNFVADKEEARKTIKAKLSGNMPPSKGLERIYRRKDGSTFAVLVDDRLILDERGHITGIRCTVQDITERKRAEEEKKRLEAQLIHAQKMEAIGTLAGGMAHNFNNLLMGIQGYASLVRLETDPASHNYQRLRSIESLVHSGSTLTQQLLGYARGGNYVVKPVSLNQLVKETSDTFGMTKKEIRVHLKLAEDLPGIRADKGQIQQVLLNLYVNAADAMPMGGDLFLSTVKVTDRDIIDKKYKIKAGGYILLTVRDTGLGMDQKTMERIFEPFFTTKDVGKGTGLGLASVYGTIKAHGGYIDVSSTQGQGTTFEIFFPASEEELVENGTPAKKFHRNVGTVLLVGDENTVVDIGKQFLEVMGYNVFTSQSGKEALEVYEKNLERIDLVILDLIMPDMGGGRVFDRMKEINPRAKVLLTSGYSIDGHATEILQRGCDGFLQKPFTIERLSKKIREILNNG